MKEKANKKQKRTRNRSPNYPGINLETAIDRSKILWQKEKDRFTPVEVALSHWGYGSKSSSGLVILAALKKFGLIEDVGLSINRKIKLSDLAKRIILDEREYSTERDEALQEAALNPTIHKELWESCNRQIPSDESLKYDLRKRGFTEGGLNEFIQEFKESLSFAKVSDSGTISGQDQDNFPNKKEKKMDHSSSTETREHKGYFDFNKAFLGLLGSPQQPKIIEIPMPLSSTESVKIQATYPLSEKAWGQMLNILNAYKPSLVPLVDKGEDEKKGK